MPAGRLPVNYFMPLGWPMRSWGKWQLHDVFVVNVTKLEAARERCIGKRVVYVHEATSAPLWEELYDEKLQPWRFVGIFQRTLDVPNTWPVVTFNSMVYGFWDVKYSHPRFLPNRVKASRFTSTRRLPMSSSTSKGLRHPEG